MEPVHAMSDTASLQKANRVFVFRIAVCALSDVAERGVEKRKHTYESERVNAVGAHHSHSGEEGDPVSKYTRVQHCSVRSLIFHLLRAHVLQSI